MEENEIIRVLGSIGLRRNEAIVYLDLIRVGKSSAIDVSKRTRLHRSNVYDTLRKLLKKGFVDQSIENRKKFFYPIDPKDLLDYHKQKEEELKEIIPKIEEIHNKPKEERKVTISEGLKSARNILICLLDLGEPIHIYGTPKDATEILGGFVNEFNRIRIKKKIPLKHIYGIESMGRIRVLNQMPYTEARYLPSQGSRISTNICGNKVAIIIWDMPISTIVIKNKAIADTYRNNFNILWDEAKDI